jgi:predicted CXXCH cytochrome family protein
MIARRFAMIAPLMAGAAVLAIGALIRIFPASLGDGLKAHAATDAPAPAFVGSETCAGCHQVEVNVWQNSQHKLAMQHASDKSALGDFNDATFDYHGVHSRFFRKDGKYLVETDGPDGKLATFEIKYTFGVDPLQQYLVQFPDGRLQALSIAWDSRPKEQGGQRWFHLYQDQDIKHDDVLHWTKLNQNWNFMCAECHSTGVRKNYDASRDRFATTWSDINVGCEACHGQGSTHVAWARDQKSWWPFGKREDPSKGLLVRFDERQNVNWWHDPKTGDPRRNYPPALVRKEVETCGLCHARRSEFSEDWIPGRPLSDTHVVAGLEQGLYYADGQMRDEVYNYSSFKQSKMFAAGVACSDCHDPHTAKLRVAGDGICLQCHAPEKYAAASSHSHHEALNPPLACASCHMPVRTYMVIDRRHDHSFRIPRPDLSAKLGTPNACNDCHADKSPEWAAAAVERWFGPNREGFQNYAEAFHAAWNGSADAAALLGNVASNQDTPAFARASALTDLAPYLPTSAAELVRTGLKDPDPMVRIGALAMLENVPPSQIWPYVSPLLSDPSRGVRIRAVRMLAAVPTDNQPAADRASFEQAAAEFIAAQRLNADRPESRTTLGNFFVNRGRTTEAETEFKAALRLSPQYPAATINLADLYRQLGRDKEGESVLRDTIAVTPLDAGLHYALGLTLTRLKQPAEEALSEFQRATELDPNRARYAYVYAVGLHSAGRNDEAMDVLKRALDQHPGDRDVLLALVTFNRDAGNLAAAVTYAEKAVKLAPDDRELAALLQMLRTQANKTDSR